MSNININLNVGISKKSVNFGLVIISAFLGFSSVDGALYLAKNSNTSNTTLSLANDVMTASAQLESSPLEVSGSHYGFPCEYIAVMEQGSPTMCSKNGSSDLSGKNNVPDAFYNDDMTWFTFSSHLAVEKQQCNVAVNGPAMQFNPTSIRQIDFADDGKFEIKKWVCVKNV